MISLGPILIFAVAVSIIVTYVLIVHKSLSGDAANDPNYDANSVTSRASKPTPRASRAESDSHVGGHHKPSHA